MATGTQNSNPFREGYNDRFTREQQRPPSQLDQTQQQVQEVVTIMRSNVEKVMERDSRLSELDARADSLSNSAHMFERRSNQVRRKMWWNNLKWKIILAVVVILSVVGIGFWIATSFKSDGGSGSESTSYVNVPNETNSVGGSNATKT
jgi:vesicle-associated membrane protein 2